MDESEDFILIRQLKRMLAQRYDGYWEFLATAAGKAESVSKTRLGISAETLAKGAFGAAVSPVIIRERVESLAAYDVTALATLASQWIPPENIGDGPWFAAAWNAALRHLKDLGLINLRGVHVAELQDEIDLLWGPPTPACVSWRVLLENSPSEFVLYDYCRRAARSAMDEAVLFASDLEGAPWQMLRLLRGRTSILDKSAVALLADRALKWEVNSMESVLAAELCAEVLPATLPTMRRQLTEALPTVSDPRSVIPLAYVLIGDWRSP